MSDAQLGRTLDAVEVHGWRVVLLQPRSKKPKGTAWHITQNLDEIAGHVAKDGNIGLVCGQQSGVAVLDFDAPGAFSSMCTALGYVQPWVETGSGKFHCYVQWEDGLPARMMWEGEKIGEIQRGPALQHVVIPPSLHPVYDQKYKWLVDPCSMLLPLPDAWRTHLLLEEIPSFMPVGVKTGHPDDEPWDGPPADEILNRAMRQPGATRRRNGVKMQCPGCRKLGRDRSKDNALVGLDGRWGCAVDPSHSRDIGEALGIVSVAREVLGEDADELRPPSIDDLG